MTRPVPVSGRLRVPARAASRKTWCGPYAAAVLSGLDYDEAHATAARIKAGRTGSRRVLGMSIPHILGTLSGRGARSGQWFRPGCRVGDLPARLAGLLPDPGFFLVATARHAFVFDAAHGTVIDNNTGGWIPIPQFRFRNHPVEHAIEVEPHARAWRNPAAGTRPDGHARPDIGFRVIPRPPAVDPRLARPVLAPQPAPRLIPHPVPRPEARRIGGWILTDRRAQP